MLEAMQLLFSWLPLSIRALLGGALLIFVGWVLIKLFLAVKDIIF